MKWPAVILLLLSLGITGARAQDKTSQTFTIAVSAHDVTLSWTPPTLLANGNPLPTGSVITYNVFRGSTPGGEGLTPINPVPVSTAGYKDIKVIGGATYYYYVEAINTLDGVTSPPSVPSMEATATVPSP